MNRIPLVIICGPTAVGKSRAAVSLAEGLGEIISADSMQVYKYLDIGTAKPEKELLKRVKHHLINIVKLDNDFTAYDFIKRAKLIIEQIYKKNMIPFVVGGTGMYIRSLVYGLSEAPGRDEVFRKKMENMLKQKGPEMLYEKLKKIDPEYAVQIKANDRVRIIRALEVYHSTGKVFSYFFKKHDRKENYNTLWIGLDQPREVLYERINKRTEYIYTNGLLEETKKLLEKGYSEDILKRKGIGYTEALDYIHNRMTYEQAVEETKKKTRNYAKRQLTWFRKEKKIKWFQPEEIDKMKKSIKRFIVHSS